MKRIITLSTLALLLAATSGLQAGEREHEPGRHHERPRHDKTQYHGRDRDSSRHTRIRERIIVRDRHRPARHREAHHDYRHGTHAPWAGHAPHHVQRRTVVRERIVHTPSRHHNEAWLTINYPIWY